VWEPVCFAIILRLIASTRLSLPALYSVDAAVSVQSGTGVILNYPRPLYIRPLYLPSRLQTRMVLDLETSQATRTPTVRLRPHEAAMLAIVLDEGDPGLASNPFSRTTALRFLEEFSPTSFGSDASRWQRWVLGLDAETIARLYSRLEDRSKSLPQE
jgi:hypothetical protein